MSDIFLKFREKLKHYCDTAKHMRLKFRRQLVTVKVLRVPFANYCKMLVSVSHGLRVFAIASVERARETSSRKDARGDWKTSRHRISRSGFETFDFHGFAQSNGEACERSPRVDLSTSEPKGMREIAGGHGEFIERPRSLFPPLTLISCAC